MKDTAVATQPDSKGDGTMTWKQFFYPEKCGMRYTWKLTLMRAIVAELFLWVALFLLNLSTMAYLALSIRPSFASVMSATWKSTWLWFLPLSPVSPLAYAAVAWHFTRCLSGKQGPVDDHSSTTRKKSSTLSMSA